MKCFVIMPFGNPAQDPESAARFRHVYEDWIKAAVEEVEAGAHVARIDCYRGDTETRPGEVLPQVLESLADADFVIADLTGRNANVFYELGVRHVLRNNTILIAQNMEDIPFNLRGQRAIAYRYDPPSLIDLKRSLKRSLAAMIASPAQIDNPVRRLLADREVERLVSAPVPPGYDALRQLVDEMQVLREDLAKRVIEIRTLVQNTTSAPHDAAAPDRGQHAQLEGAWTSREHGGLYVFKVVRGELFGPYCYQGRDHLTAHFFNVQVVGPQILCRFKWLEGRVEGCALFTFVGNDRLAGGWWYLDTLPRATRRDLKALHSQLPAMNPLHLDRIQMPNPLPSWLVDYFKRVERGEWQPG